MHHHVKRSLRLGLAMLTAIAVVAAPANASLTPVAVAVTTLSSNTSLTRGGVRIRCPRSDFTGTIAAGGNSASGTLTFGGRTCTESLLGTSCTITGSSTIRITVQSSVAGNSASGRLNLDRANWTWDCPTVGTRSTFNRANQDMGACLTFTQATQTLTLTNCAMVDDTGHPAVLNGLYILTPRLTVS